VTGVLDFLPLGELQIALNEIAPRQAAAFRRLGFVVSEQWRSTLQMRMADIRRGREGFSFAGNSMVEAEQGDGDGSAFFAPAPEKRWGTWVDGAGVFGNVENSPVLNRGSISGGAFTTGVDYALADNLFLGLYTGYAGVKSEPASGTALDSDSARFGLYGSYGLGGFYVSGLVGGSSQNYDWRRNIVVPGLAVRNATANPEGDTFETLLETGYETRLGAFNVGGYGTA